MFLTECSRPQVKKPILQSADYSGNVLEKIQTRLPLFAPSCSPATEKVVALRCVWHIRAILYYSLYNIFLNDAIQITVYLKRSYQCAKDIAQMRKLLENFFGSNFKNQYEPLSVPPIPLPLGGINEPDEILIQLTNTTEYEITALEVRILSKPFLLYIYSLYSLRYRDYHSNLTTVSLVRIRFNTPNGSRPIWNN